MPFVFSLLLSSWNGKYSGLLLGVQDIYIFSPRWRLNFSLFTLCLFFFCLLASSWWRLNFSTVQSMLLFFSKEIKRTFFYVLLTRLYIFWLSSFVLFSTHVCLSRFNLFSTVYICQSFLLVSLVSPSVLYI